MRLSQIISLLIFVCFCFSPRAENLSPSQFSYLGDSELADQIPAYLNGFTQLSDSHKAQMAESLVLKIFALYPEPTYESTLKSLRDLYNEQPESIEYLARFLHTTWLARYGSLSVNTHELSLTSEHQNFGLMGLVLTGATSWKNPGQWARHARLARYLFVPMGVSSPLFASSPTSRTPTAPMVYFDFPIPAEQINEIEYQAYEELLTDISSLGVASGLTHLLMSAQQASGALTRTSLFGSRLYKPLLLMAALTYGVSGITGMIANEMRFNDLNQNWQARRQSIEAARENEAPLSFSQVDSFLQASRQMSFFMFYPILQIQSEEEGSLNQFTEDSLRLADERSTQLNQVVEVLQAQLDHPGFLYDNPAYLQASTLVSSLAAQSFDEVQLQVLNSQNRVNTNEEFQAVLDMALREKIAELQAHISTLPQSTYSDIERRQEAVYNSLRDRVRHVLWNQDGTRCHYEFEKYEYLQRQQSGRTFSTERWWEFLVLGSYQNHFYYNQTPLDAWIKSQDLSRNQVVQTAMSLENVTNERDLLHQKWQHDWKNNRICRHSPLFLTQTYEYLARIDQPLTQQAAHQNLELLVAQKILIQSLLY